MRLAWTLVFASLFGCAPAVEEAPSSDALSTEPIRRGWSTTPAIGAYTLEEIVTRSDVRVRTDDAACVTCHTWAARSDRVSFCERVDAFLALPEKPAAMKELLRDWRAGGCAE